MKSSKERFFEKIEDATDNWMADMFETLVQLNPNGLGNLLKEKRGLLDALNANLSYSNDPFLNRIMKFYIDNSNDEIKEELERCWIGKHNEEGSTANAGAHKSDPSYKGYLITYNFELDNLIRQVSEVFACYLTLVKFSPEPNSSLFKLCRKSMLNSLVAIKDWTQYEVMLAEQFPEEVRLFYNKACGDFYLAGSMFVLAHEIGHHLLMHTSQLFYKFVKHNIAYTNKSHEEEYAADEFAVNFLYSSLYENCPSGAFPTIEYLAGPLVGTIAIALLTSNAYVDSISHPSARNRWFKIIEEIKGNCPKDEFETLMSLFNTINGYIQGILKWWNKEWWVKQV